MNDRDLMWVGSSREDLRSFPDDVRRAAGYQLRLVQEGLDPSDWRPMPSVGMGAREIRLHFGREHRVLYVASFQEAVYVLHAFEKRSRKTSRHDIGLARRRFRQLVMWRMREKA